MKRRAEAIRVVNRIVRYPAMMYRSPISPAKIACQRGIAWVASISSPFSRLRLDDGPMGILRRGEPFCLKPVPKGRVARGERELFPGDLGRSDQPGVAAVVVRAERPAQHLGAVDDDHDRAAE